MSTQTITEFLLSRIAEDEAMARQEDEDYADTTLLPTYDSEHQAAWNTARVLAECAAKRTIIEDWPDVFGAWSADEAAAASAVKDLMRKRLAAVYADHPDCREEEWAL